MRIRTIKPEFWRSDDITALPREQRLLFIGLWSYVDDNGVGVDDFRAIAADLFALEDDQKEVRDFVREGLATLSRALLVARYKVDGKPYLFITAWDKHQRIDRPSKARHPRPPEDWTPPTSGNDPDGQNLDAHSRDSRDSLDAGTGEQGNRGTGEQGRKTPARKRAAASELALVPEPTAALAVVPDVTAQTAVAEWVDAFKATGNQPLERQIKQAGKEAKDLIAAGNDPARVVALARSAGSKCRATIANELALTVSRNGTYTPRPSTSDARVSEALALADTYPEDSA